MRIKIWQLKMKSRLLIIIGILLPLIVIVLVISPFYILGSLLFPLEHCPELAMKMALGLADPTVGCA